MTSSLSVYQFLPMTYLPAVTP